MQSVAHASVNSSHFAWKWSSDGTPCDPLVPRWQCRERTLCAAVYNKNDVSELTTSSLKSAFRKGRRACAYTDGTMHRFTGGGGGGGAQTEAHLVLVVQVVLAEKLSSNDDIFTRSLGPRANLTQFDDDACRKCVAALLRAERDVKPNRRDTKAAYRTSYALCGDERRLSAAPFLCFAEGTRPVPARARSVLFIAMASDEPCLSC